MTIDTLIQKLEELQRTRPELDTMDISDEDTLIVHGIDEFGDQVYMEIDLYEE